MTAPTLPQLIAGIHDHLPDARVLAAVDEFFAACDRQIRYDDQLVVLAPDVTVHIRDKALVVDRSKRGGAYFTARVVLDPILEDGRHTGLSRNGTLKIIFDLAGAYVDDVYSRDDVIDDA